MIVASQITKAIESTWTCVCVCVGGGGVYCNVLRKFPLLSVRKHRDFVLNVSYIIHRTVPAMELPSAKTRQTCPRGV